MGLMRATVRVCVVSLVASSLFSGSAEALKPKEATGQGNKKGKQIYEQSCLFCHGVNGKGDGPAAFFNAAYMAPRPTDFTVGSFKFRSTPSGELPMDQDLFRTVTRGVPGYMPSFRSLTEQERWSVISYIKTFYPGFQKEKPESIPLTVSPVPSTPESIERGRMAYFDSGCQGCHGDDADGEGTLARAKELMDQSGLPIRPGDLTSRSSLKNGSAPQDLYRSIMTGLDGTPHPSFLGQYANKEEEIWHLVNYLLSLSE
ncbi:MAG: c-type cytochrome [Nitrospira sp.]|nr:MAG: c-type cytochrome [Nitrospira sp.]